MANIAKVTELDFDTIKQNLKDYYNRKESPFRDWDFEGSGLNYLLDILAYNTHYNAVNAHLSMNESFLDSAQIRSNAVSRAKLISYTPRSRRGARATVTLNFTRIDNSTETLTLPRGTTFSTNIDGKKYIFSTREDYEAVFNTATQLFTFENVIIVQGSLVERSYIVDSSVINQRFIIDDVNIDTSTLEVIVQEHGNSTVGQTFLDGDLFTSYDENTLAYFLSENYEGKYQIEFGDGIIGKKLDNLNIVKISFLTSQGNLVNGARQFSFIRVPATELTFNTIASIKNMVTTGPAFGGDERESIESIRKVAPYTFIAQNRAVTTTDYESLIKKNIPDIEAISVWGGQDNDPPIYGKVFLSAKPKSAFFLTSAQKDEISNYLNRVKILTVKPEIVDPNYIYLYFDVFFKFNPNLTTKSRTQLESLVKSSIETFNIENLGGFDKIFRYSRFLSAIDSTEGSILNSYSRIYVYKTLNLIAADRLPLEVNFNLELFGDLDQEESIISTSSWKYNNQDVYLADEPISLPNSIERNVFMYRLSTDGSTKIKIFPTVGTLNIKTGKLRLEPIPTTYDVEIQIKAIPDAYDVATVRNQLITIDLAQTIVTGDIDDTFNTGAADRTYDTVSRFR